MAAFDTLEHLSSFARIDPDAITDAGVWVAPLLPPAPVEGYQTEAILPDKSAGKWLGKAAVEPLFADASTPAAAVVELVHRIPGELSSAMQAYPRSSIGPDGRGVRSSAEAETAALEAAAEKIGGTLLGIALAQPDNLTTTTVPCGSNFPGRGLKVGFHLDNRDKKPIAERVDSRRRFIASRGPGFRMAAVLLPDIVTVARVLGYPDELVPDYDIYREFLRKYPNGAICVGIPVRPGQGSLMNTDLYVHDGMTMDATQESMTFQMLGEWDRGELALVA